MIDFETAWQGSHNRGHLRLAPGHGEVILNGMETGKVTVVEAQLNGIFQLHEEGASYWSMRGQRGYAGASYRTVLVDDVEAFADGRSTRYVQLSHFDVPRNAAERSEKTTTLAERLLRFIADNKSEEG